jgi:hypothetical protein
VRAIALFLNLKYLAAALCNYTELKYDFINFKP